MALYEDFRPRLHFSPSYGWMNDPNGLIVVDGQYHLFFQHDPHSLINGPMHWGHASSGNLVDWVEHPVALAPDELGACWSGSAIETEQGEIKLFYTASCPIEGGGDAQTQCLVHVDRQVTSFQREPSNPVMPNPGLEAFRDPKVFWHGPSQHWVMLVTLGQKIGFYRSTDLQNWTFASSFGEADGYHNEHPWECPDLVELDAPGGSRHWVLIVGVGIHAYAIGSGTQYFIGSFDGFTFVNANAPTQVLWLDHGRDYYATQTFFDRRGGVPLAIGWASNWVYGRETPTQNFRGSMALARELSLVESSGGLRVAAKVPAAVGNRFPLWPEGAVDGVFRYETHISLAVGQEFALTLFGESEPQTLITRVSAERAVLRTKRAQIEGMPDFGHDYTVDFDWPEAGSDLALFVDRGLTELTLNQGSVWLTQIFFPQTCSGALTASIA